MVSPENDSDHEEEDRSRGQKEKRQQVPAARAILAATGGHISASKEQKRQDGIPGKGIGRCRSFLAVFAEFFHENGCLVGRH